MLISIVYYHFSTFVLNLILLFQPLNSSRLLFIIKYMRYMFHNNDRLCNYIFTFAGIFLNKYYNVILYAHISLYFIVFNIYTYTYIYTVSINLHGLLSVLNSNSVCKSISNSFLIINQHSYFVQILNNISNYTLY